MLASNLNLEFQVHTWNTKGQPISLGGRRGPPRIAEFIHFPSGGDRFRLIFLNSSRPVKVH